MKKEDLKLVHLPRFLCGERRAILAFASDRRTLWLSLVFVFSAALARRYDGTDLLAEPLALVLPALVSWFNASVLYVLLHLLVGRRAESAPNWLDEYRAVLGLFWLTAPLAWLYAIPVERFLDPYDATVANLWLLLLVATWRVVLMSRVVSVIYGVGGWRAFFVVMFFADLVAVGLMIASPKPMVSIMAGIAHTAKDSLILEITLGVIFWGIASLPIWFIGMGFATFKVRGAWQVGDAKSDDRVSRGLWAVAALSILVWLPTLPFTQAEQRLARQVDELLATDQIDEALDQMTLHARVDFPPSYDPRPHQWPGRTLPDVLDVMPKLADREVPNWVREAYLAKLDLRLHDARYFSPEQIEGLAELRGRIEGLDPLLEKHEFHLVEQRQAEPSPVNKD